MERLAQNIINQDFNINESFISQIFIDGNKNAHKTDKYKRILAIGDIHGNFSKLINVLKKAQLTSNDFLIFLGDYTDRGNENKKVMQFVLNLYDQPNIVFLLGNHDEMLLEHFTKCAYKVLHKQITINDINNLSNSQFIDIFKEMLVYYNNYLPNGGQTTLQEINIFNSDDIKLFKHYLQVIYELPMILPININNKEYIFVHAGIDPNKDLDKQNIYDLLWIRDEFYDNYMGDTTVVVGHTPTLAFNTSQPLPIFRHNNIIMCDTGAFIPNGKLTIVDIMTKQYWQSYSDIELGLY